MVLELDQNVKLILEILSKNDKEKAGLDFEATTSADFLYPHSYQFPAKNTPPRSTIRTDLMVMDSTPSVKEVQPTDIDQHRFKRRKFRAKRLKDFTNPSGKLFKVNDPCEFDPLRPYDKDQFHSFNKWLAGLVDNTIPIDVGIGTGDVSWFIDLKSLGKWIDGKHIDAAFHLIRERVWNFPKTYGENFTIEDSVIDQFFTGRYEKFKSKSNKTQYHFDDAFSHYVDGSKDMFRRPWKDVEYIYYGLNINGNHWILLQICLTSWHIVAYDSDLSLNTDEKFEAAMKPMCNMLPYLLLAAGFDTEKYLDLKDLQPFNCHCEPISKVPQSKKSGDYGAMLLSIWST